MRNNRSRLCGYVVGHWLIDVCYCLFLPGWTGGPYWVLNHDNMRQVTARHLVHEIYRCVLRAVRMAPLPPPFFRCMYVRMYTFYLSEQTQQQREDELRVCAAIYHNPTASCSSTRLKSSLFRHVHPNYLLASCRALVQSGNPLIKATFLLCLGLHRYHGMSHTLKVCVFGWMDDRYTPAHVCYVCICIHGHLTLFFFSLSLSFPKYVAKASQTLRAALKEPSKSKALLREGFSYNRSLWKEGKQGPKTRIQSLSIAGSSA